MAQLLPLRQLFDATARTWVTFPTADAVGALRDERDVVWAHHPTTRNVPNLWRNTLLAWSVLRSRRPDLIVTTGAAVALPYFVLSRLFGAQTVYIEVYDRVDSPTLTARLCSPFTDLFAVQWPEQSALYRETSMIGPLL
ncbi:UDP-N-acetylglucosamine transferase subunit ALG14 [Microbacterium lacticum]|uniref:UDP-N-acetylglucosamine transferase subunit ALG14 n=1 Tax=Microbacterium lacticum TaxID=33885 RepID=UPI001F586996|nr:UDP-N-acetylglucosamine transferase subunit ALG14 [Microbacterium lacticum]